jgi:DNA-binding transcriptional ArsR family regulator
MRGNGGDPSRLTPEAKAVMALHEQPRLEDALDHRLRRNLLRLLHELTPPCTVEDVIGSDPDLLDSISRSEASYHVNVLERNGAIESAGVQIAGAWEVPMYVSAVSDDPIVLEVLAMTAVRDAE